MMPQQTRLQQTPTPPHNHPQRTDDLSRVPINPMPNYYQARGVATNPQESMGSIWGPIISPQTPAIPNTYNQQHYQQQQPYTIPQPIYGISGLSPVGYPEQSYGQHQQDIQMGQHGGYNNPGTGLDVEHISDIWRTAPPNFEYDEWGQWMANDPNTMGMPQHQQQHQQQQQPHHPHQR